MEEGLPGFHYKGRSEWAGPGKSLWERDLVLEEAGQGPKDPAGGEQLQGSRQDGVSVDGG